MAAKGCSNSQCDHFEGLKKYVSRTLSWAGQVARMGESRGAYGVLVRRPDRRRRLGRPTLKWENNINIDLREVGWEGMDWCDLAQDRDRWWALVNAVTNLRIP